MKTPQQAAADIATAAAALHDAVAQSGNGDYARIESMLNFRVQQFVTNPTAPVTQAYADAVGGDLRALKQEMTGNLDIDLLEIEAVLHDQLSQALVDYAPDVDWYQAADVPPPANGMNQPQSGSKHKPTAS